MKVGLPCRRKDRKELNLSLIHKVKMDEHVANDLAYWPCLTCINPAPEGARVHRYMLAANPCGIP
ncbi:hypothetical protein GCM10010970_01720 [Silvimonas iriomotensis]|uniref:Uncharacterized protein n=1 Tax=Silvimonas iriomotensis TaxID=449662 RepID=A0ABQ2P3Y6_9NEIS|nr:hypothetical protein GCM10010970_01720 [Silvimonas iriomotensis]